jgi:hypothetical protein
MGEGEHGEVRIKINDIIVSYLTLRMSPSYLDGFSTFYVDSNSKIYQHTVDRVMEDKDKVVSKTIIQKLVDLKQRAAAEPALSCK